MPTIQEIAKTHGFRGTPQHRIAEPNYVKTLPVIDNSVHSQSNVRTSIDCYVSGQYTSKDGKVIEVTQRYTIFVSYSRSTQQQTMSEVRDRIMSDFQERYGTGFHISNTFVPALPVPKEDIIPGIGPGKAEPLEMYKGSGLFKSMTEYERQRFDIGTERAMSRTNIDSIRKRYKTR